MPPKAQMFVAAELADTNFGLTPCTYLRLDRRRCKMSIYGGERRNEESDVILSEFLAAEQEQKRAQCEIRTKRNGRLHVAFAFNHDENPDQSPN